MRGTLLAFLLEVNAIIIIMINYRNTLDRKSFQPGYLTLVLVVCLFVSGGYFCCCCCLFVLFGVGFFVLCRVLVWAQYYRKVWFQVGHGVSWSQSNMTVLETSVTNVHAKNTHNEFYLKHTSLLLCGFFPFFFSFFFFFVKVCTEPTSCRQSTCKPKTHLKVKVHFTTPLSLVWLLHSVSWINDLHSCMAQGYIPTVIQAEFLINLH